MTAPVLSDFVIAPVSQTTASVSIRSDTKNGTIYFVVIPSSSAVPSAAQVIAGTDGSGNAATWDNTFTVASIDSYGLGPQGLGAGQTYKAYAVHQNSVAENSSVAVSNTLTSGVADLTAPTLSDLTAAALSFATALLQITTDEDNGVIFWVVALASATAPTAAQVIAGTDGSGVHGHFVGITPVSSTGTKTKTAIGLVADTLYTVYVVHRDAIGNISARSGADFATPAGSTIGYMIAWHPPVYVVDTDSAQHMISGSFIVESTTPTVTRRQFAIADALSPSYFVGSLAAPQHMLSSIYIR
jgi:hypothetical protein